MKKGPSAGFSESWLQEVVDCGKQFYDRRWMYGTAGNLSVKVNQSPLEIAITPSGAHKGSLKPTDLIHLKDKGDGKLEPQVKKGAELPIPSAETAIHQAIHQTLPGCGAVFHVHPVHATLLSALVGNPQHRQTLEIEWFEMLKCLGIGEGEIGMLPIFPNWQDIPKVAQEVHQYLLQTPNAPPAILLYNHGVTAWGRNPEQARNHLEAVEYVCEYLYLKKQLKS